HVRKAAHLADPAPDQGAEDDEVERRGDGRRYERLAPDADDAPVLPDDDRLETDPADDPEIDRRRWRLLCNRRAQGRPPPCARIRSSAATARSPGSSAGPVTPGAVRPSTRRMKISSRRFTLFRMLSTSIPSAERRAKISFRLCSLLTSTSSVW